MSDENFKYADARKHAIEEFEKDYLAKLLDRMGGNVSQAAREAGIDRVYLHRLLRKHDIRSSGRRGPTPVAAAPAPEPEQPKDQSEAFVSNTLGSFSDSVV